MFGFDIGICNVLETLIRVIERRVAGEVVMGAKVGERWMRWGEFL